METLTITSPDDMHLHVRDGEVLTDVLADTARQFSRAIIMPNLAPPITTTQQANEYQQRIIQHLPEDAQDFMPLMTLYLTDNTSVEEIKRAAESEFVHAVKYYPAGATTNSDSGVTSIDKVYPVLEAMAEHNLPLLVHGEVTAAEIDVFDREAIFIEQVLSPLMQKIPELRIVFEHITTRDAVEFIQSAGNNLFATITPQHLMLNRNALFTGGIRPHHYCLPVLKAEDHRKAILKAATSGNAKFFLGTDSAPHAKDAKESACGCAGIYSAHSAIELYVEAFEAENALDKFEAFASHYGAGFYGLARNERKITLVKEPWQIPESLPFGDSTIVPFRSGEQCQWKLTA